MRSASFAYAAFFSRSCFHCPRVARLFIMARWMKARWAAATFSLLPDQAFCGAAWSAAVAEGDAPRQAADAVDGVEMGGCLLVRLAAREESDAGHGGGHAGFEHLHGF